MLLPVWKWHWNSRRKILARFCETLKQSYTQMKAAIPDSINIKNHFWAPVKLYCFPPGLDRFDPQAQQTGEDSPTALRASRAARGPAARREVPCCHLQSGYHQRDLCLLSLLTDNTLFLSHFLPYHWGSLNCLLCNTSVEYELSDFCSLQENLSCSTSN